MLSLLFGLILVAASFAEDSTDDSGIATVANVQTTAATSPPIGTETANPAEADASSDAAPDQPLETETGTPTETTTTAGESDGLPSLSNIPIRFREAKIHKFKCPMLSMEVKKIPLILSTQKIQTIYNLVALQPVGISRHLKDIRQRQTFQQKLFPTVKTIVTGFSGCNKELGEFLKSISKDQFDRQYIRVFFKLRDSSPPFDCLLVYTYIPMKRAKTFVRGVSCRTYDRFKGIILARQKLDRTTENVSSVATPKDNFEY